MGLKNLVKRLDDAMGAISRENVVRAFTGQPAESVDEAALHDVIDSIPIIGDAASFRRVMTNKGNRMAQFGDAVIGVVPILGDVADLLITPDTNIVQVQEDRSKKMGPVETFFTGKWFSNIAERYIGGNKDRNIWKD